MSEKTGCPSCAVVSGADPPPGGVVFEFPHMENYAAWKHTRSLDRLLDIRHRLGLKRTYPNEVVSQYVEKFFQAYLELTKYNPLYGST